MSAAERGWKSHWKDLSDVGVCGPGENCPFSKPKDKSGDTPLHTSVYPTEDGFQTRIHMYTPSFFLIEHYIHVCVCMCIYVCIYIYIYIYIYIHGLTCWLRQERSTCNVGDLGSIPRLGRSPGGGHGNSLQYFCLKNPLDGRAWWATVHGVAKSWM